MLDKEKIDIDSKVSVFVPKLGKQLDMNVYNTLKKAKIPQEQMHQYEEALDPKLPFFTRVRRFLTATNKAGRKAKVFKDFALMFFPWGEQVGDITEFATNVLKPEQQLKLMNGTKKWYKSKTVNSIIIIIVLVATQFLGIEITEAELQETITAIGVAIAGVVALYGRFTAKDKLE